MKQEGAVRIDTLSSSSAFRNGEFVDEMSQKQE